MSYLSINDHVIPIYKNGTVYYRLNKNNLSTRKIINNQKSHEKRKLFFIVPIILIFLAALFYTSGYMQTGITGFLIIPSETEINETIEEQIRFQEVEYNKIQEDEDFNVVIHSSERIGNTLKVVFSHDSSNEEVFFIRGDISYSFSQNPAPSNRNVVLTVPNWNYDYFELQVGEASAVIAFGREEIKINPKIEDSHRNIVASTLNFKDMLTDEEIIFEITTVSSPENIKVGRYDVTINPFEHPVKEIFIPNFDVQQELTGLLRVDEIPEEYIQFYAIDPSSIEFEYANVTVSAKGNRVYKCEDWNFDSRICEGEWEFMMSITPGEDYTFSITPDDPAFAEVPIAECRAQSNTATSGSFGIECDYPDGSALKEEGDLEAHNFGKAAGPAGSQRYAGVWTNSSNENVTNCDEIISVELCYEWWRTSDVAEICDVSYSLDDGDTWTAITTTCPGTTTNPGVSCVNITDDEDWTCEDFFGENATGVLAKSEVSGSTGAGAGYTGTATWDLLMFNVSYDEKDEDVCIVQLSTNTFDFGTITPGTNTGSNNILLTISNNGTIQAVNTTVKGDNWNDGNSKTMNINQTKFDVTNLTYGNLNYFLSASEIALPDGNISAGGSLNTYWGLGIPQHQSPDDYNQTITIIMNC